MRILGLIFKILIFPFKYLYVLLHIIARWSIFLLFPCALLVDFVVIGYICILGKFLLAAVYFAICFLPLYIFIHLLGPYFIMYDSRNKTIFKYYFFGNLEYKLSSLAYDLFVIWYMPIGIIVVLLADEPQMFIDLIDNPQLFIDLIKAIINNP